MTERTSVYVVDTGEHVHPNSPLARMQRGEWDKLCPKIPTGRHVFFDEDGEKLDACATCGAPNKGSEST